MRRIVRAFRNARGPGRSERSRSSTITLATSDTPTAMAYARPSHATRPLAATTTRMVATIAASPARVAVPIQWCVAMRPSGTSCRRAKRRRTWSTSSNAACAAGTANDPAARTTSSIQACTSQPGARQPVGDAGDRRGHPEPRDRVRHERGERPGEADLQQCRDEGRNDRRPPQGGHARRRELVGAARDRIAARHDGQREADTDERRGQRGAARGRSRLEQRWIDEWRKRRDPARVHGADRPCGRRAENRDADPSDTRLPR